MNETLHNGYESSVIGLLYSHTIPQYKQSMNLNEMNMSVENGDVNGDYCYINSSTGCVIKNHNIIHYTNKIDEFLPK